MILLLNGSFGIGKTTVARLLRQVLPGSAIYDPEWVGLVLMRVPSFVGLHGVGTDDFQDIHLWRKSVVIGTKMTRACTRGAVIVPMAFSRPDYFQEIIAGLRRLDNEVRVFCLKADLSTILQRLRNRGTRFNSSEGEWIIRKAQMCVDAHRAAYFGEPINTNGISAAEVSQEILNRLKHHPATQTKFRGFGKSCD
jgi:hypothetical protein